MPTTSSSPVPAIEPGSERALEAAELIDRLATEMRATGDRELPHAFYVEQVKRQLAGKNTDTTSAPVQEQPLRAAGGAPSSVFHSWAMPET